MAAPVLAAVVVLVAGLMTPGYDPVARTVSRLAVPGLPAATAVGLVIALVGSALLGLALTIEAAATHRLATLVAMVALTGAPLAVGWRRYGRLSFGLGAAAAVMLLACAALLPTGFASWGFWERCFLALPMAWMLRVSLRILRSRSTGPVTARWVGPKREACGQYVAGRKGSRPARSDLSSAS